jgi:hypothetical protein
VINFRKLVEWLIPTERDRWWYAANSLRMEGYTESEIVDEIGPEPIAPDSQEKSDA